MDKNGMSITIVNGFSFGMASIVSAMNTGMFNRHIWIRYPVMMTAIMLTSHRIAKIKGKERNIKETIYYSLIGFIIALFADIMNTMIIYCIGLR